MKRKIIFQALNWKLKDIKNSLGKIKKAGFNTVQVSPLQGIKENNGHWLHRKQQKEQDERGLEANNNLQLSVGDTSRTYSF